MHTHSMTFVTLDKLVSPSSSVNGDPLDDSPDHWQPHSFFEFPLRRTCGGRTWPAPSERKDLPASGRYGNGDLVEGRVCNVIGFNLGSTLDHSRQDLCYFGIRSAVVSSRVLCCVPKADSERFLPALSNECDFVLESFLFSKQTSCAFGAPRSMKMSSRGASRIRARLWYKHRWTAIAWRSGISVVT